MDIPCNVYYLVYVSRAMAKFCWNLLLSKSVINILVISRKWALIFPIWTCGFMIFIVIFYMATNLFNVLDLKSIHTFTGKFIKLKIDNDAFILQDPLQVYSNDPEYIPPLQDLPLYYVSRLFRQEMIIEDD